jgi:hypothetical protein
MNRCTALVVLPALFVACDASNSTAQQDVPSDPDSLVDAQAGADAVGPTTCTSHRDCFTDPLQSDKEVCNLATGQCFIPGLFYLPCDTDDDCKTYYNTSMKKCTSAKVCALPCLDPGESISAFCPNNARTCGFEGACQCTTDANCGGTAICGTVSRQCTSRCQADLDCAALTGTTCDSTTGQCVK